MDLKDEKFLILEQYKMYSESKEKFIDRQFSTNRFYLVLNIILLAVTYFLYRYVPEYPPAIVVSIVGFSISLMWWMNIDTYQTLIKVKYAKVLEYLETKLPESPYNREFVEYQNMKKKNNLIVFGDFQKYLTVALAGVYILVCAYSVVNMIKYQVMF